MSKKKAPVVPMVGVSTFDRVNTSPAWPAGGFVTRPMADRNYTVQQYTGYSVSTVPRGAWVRGQIIRQYQPEIHPPMLGYFAYDPTDPSTWVHNGG